MKTDEDKTVDSNQYQKVDSIQLTKENSQPNDNKNISNKKEEIQKSPEKKNSLVQL